MQLRNLLQAATMVFYNRRIDFIEPPDNVRNSAFSQVRISRNSISIVVEWLGIGLFLERATGKMENDPPEEERCRNEVQLSEDPEIAEQKLWRAVIARRLESGSRPASPSARGGTNPISR